MIASINSRATAIAPWLPLPASRIAEARICNSSNRIRGKALECLLTTTMTTTMTTTIRCRKKVVKKMLRNKGSSRRKNKRSKKPYSNYRRAKPLSFIRKHPLYRPLNWLYNSPMKIYWKPRTFNDLCSLCKCSKLCSISMCLRAFGYSII